MTLLENYSSELMEPSRMIDWEGFIVANGAEQLPQSYGFDQERALMRRTETVNSGIIRFSDGCATLGYADVKSGIANMPASLLFTSWNANQARRIFQFVRSTPVRNLKF